MKIFIIIVFGSLGLIIIFMNNDLLMQGVAVANSSALESNYAGFNALVNSLPWMIPVGFVLLLGFGWWFSRQRR